MAGGVRGRGGGIASLLGVLRDHGEAVEYDLLRCGLRLDLLGSEHFTWHDFGVVVRQAQPDSALYKALTGNEWQRTSELEFLRMMEHSLRVLAWQNGGGKGEWPEPIALPWDPPRADRPDSMEWDEAFEWLGWEDPTLNLN